MAARTVKIRHDEETRAKIQASQLINRLQDYALNGGEMDSGRIKAIEILLRKTLPDLSAVQVGGDDENPVNVLHKIERVIVRPENQDG